MKKLYLLISIIFISHPIYAQLYINEFMAANSQTIADEFGEYDDWIEIFNAENSNINLYGYYLTDDLDDPTQWAFPNVIIPAKGYLLIWADNDLEQSEFHANFKLSNDGEQIGLYHGLSYVDSITFATQSKDVSFGREEDGADNWVFFELSHNPPTPGTTNVYIYVETLDPPDFTPDEGFYTGEISVELSTVDSSEKIFYTLDGSIPTITGMECTSPINITVPTTIRAIAYKEMVDSSDLISEVATKCYILNIQNAMPLINIACDPDEFDEMNNPEFYHPKDPHPSISAHFKYFDSDNVLHGNLPISFSLHGGYSVVSPKKSHKIVFTKQNFQYDLFDQDYLYPRAPDIPSSFGSLNLLGMAADYSLIRNYLSMQLLRNAGLNSPQVAFIRLFINSNDRGIYAPVERIDERYVKNHGFEPGNYDIIKTGCEHECDLTLKNLDGEYFESKAGDFEAFNEFLNWLDRYGHNYDELIKRIDLQSFLYYDMMCRFSNNRDSYDINYYLIKNRDVPNSKWIIFLWDTDESFGWDRNFNGRWFRYNFLFDQLWGNDKYVNSFYNTLADLLNTKWSYQEMDTLIQKLENFFQTDNSADEEIWNIVWYDYGAVTIPDFREDPQYNPLCRFRHLNFFREWIKNRIDFVFEKFRWAAGKAQLTIESPTGGNGSIQLNSIHLTNFPWSGTYFREIPIPITAIPDPGYRFVGWSDQTVPQTEEITITLYDDYSINAIFEQATVDYKIVINEINYNSAPDYDPEDWIELYNFSNQNIVISGWHLKNSDDQHDFILPETTILEANSFVVLCRDTTAFHSLFPSVTNYIGDLGFGFDGGGELIRLYDANENLVDSLTYDDDPPWPTEPDGNGPTLELIDPTLDNALPQSWQASENHGSPCQTNSDLVQVSYDFPIEAGGWYLISLPVIPEDANLTTLFPSAIAAYSWDFAIQNYVWVTELEPAKGYWLAIPSATTVDVWGYPLNSYTHCYTEQQGWDVIGSAFEANPMVDDPGGSIVASYSWDPALQIYVWIDDGQSLEPKKGYWIAVFGIPCTVSVGGAGAVSLRVAKATDSAELEPFYTRFGSEPPAPPAFTFQDGKLVSLPEEFGLSQNYPNPFNAETIIEYQLQKAGWVRLKIYTILGQKLRTLVDGNRPAGYHRVIWDGKNDVGQGLASGVYLYRIQVGEFTQSKKVVLLK